MQTSTDRASAQRRERRNRLRAEGRCIQCGKPRHPNYRAFCLEHARAHRERSRRANGSRTWAETGLGRQPRALSEEAGARAEEVALGKRRAAGVVRLGLLELAPPGEGMTVPEAAKRLDLTKSTVYQFIKKGRIKAYRDQPGNRTVVLEQDLRAFVSGWRRQPKRYTRGTPRPGDA